jgi:hypothetical protein
MRVRGSDRVYDDGSRSWRDVIPMGQRAKEWEHHQKLKKVKKENVLWSIQEDHSSDEIPIPAQ